MKKFKIALSLVLAFTCIFMTVIMASADDAVQVKMLNYNVAGLPSIGGIMGMQGVDIGKKQAKIGVQLNGTDYDIIAVQEDFNYHKELARGLTNFNYTTNHTGSVPGGDGLNIFSKMPVYNETRTPWDKTYGVINDGADELTPKGILYSVIDVGDGILVDFYVIHADAHEDEGSREARKDNFRQLSEMIKARGNERPVIVTGDFNASSHLPSGGSFTNYMIHSAHMKDAWTMLYNSGNHDDYSAYIEKYGPEKKDCRGIWDSIEKFLYKDGATVKVTCTDFAYVDFTDSGTSLSDHKAASAGFTFTKTEDFVENYDSLNVVKTNSFTAFFKKIGVIMNVFFKLITHVGDVFDLLK